MKIRSLMIVAVFALFSASAYADSYTCTASNGAGIYDLTVDGGSATLMVDGVAHTAMGAGSEYMFDGAFAMGDVSFNTSPTLHLPADGSMSGIMFQAQVCDGTGNSVDLTCSH